MHNKPIKDLARTLAISYAAWIEARIAKNATGTIVWGGILLDAQKALDIDLVDVHIAQAMMADARTREAIKRADDEANKKAREAANFFFNEMMPNNI